MITVDEKRVPWRESMSVADLLGELGEDRYYVVIRLNGKYVSKPNFEKTMVPQDAQIKLVPMIAGG